jgi:hypothetical protein
MPKLIDLTGQRFGAWMVLKRAETGASGHPRWLCRCICGREVEVLGCNLRAGQTGACVKCGTVLGRAARASRSARA